MMTEGENTLDRARCDVCGVAVVAGEQHCGRCRTASLTPDLQRMRERKRGVVRDFARGFMVVPGAFAVLQKHRRPLGGLVIWPVLITLVLFVTSLAGAVYAWVALTPERWHSGGELALLIVGLVFIVAVWALACFFGFTPIGCLVALPFGEALSERVETLLVGARMEEEGCGLRVFLRDTWHATWGALWLLLLSLAGFGVGLLLAPFTLGISVFVLGGFFGALDYLDFVFERKRYRFRDKLRFGLRNLPVCLGFGLAIQLLFLLPVIGLLSIPVGTVGATLVFLGAKKK